ncbi:ABC transporter substrate-binding protein, partial [Cohnella sp. REN36]|nr:peptide ABC transporter substrate-binding protein [Cohnella sp. REN36]
LQSEYKKNLGIDVAIVTKPHKGRLQTMRDGNYQMGITRWGADYDDAMSYLDEWRGAAMSSRGNYENAVYDDLLNRAINEANEQKRVELM